MRATRPLSAWITFGVLLAAALVLLLAVLYPLRQPLFLGAVLAGALSPLHEKLAKLLGGRRNASALATTAGAVLLVVVPLSAVSAFAVGEAADGVGYVRETLRAGGPSRVVAALPSPLAGWAGRALQLLPDRLEKLADPAAGGRYAAEVLSGAIAATSSFAFDLVLMVAALFVLLVDGRRLVAWLGAVSPLRGGEGRDLSGELLGDFRRAAQAVLGSTVATAAAQACAATVGFLIARVPHAPFFGLLTFFTAFIPAIGTALVSLPIAGLLWLTGHPWAALFVVGWSLLVVSMIDNLLKPLLMKGGMGLPASVVFLSLLGGIALFGPLGFVAGPLVVTFFVSMVRLGQRDFAPAAPDPSR